MVANRAKEFFFNEYDKKNKLNLVLWNTNSSCFHALLRKTLSTHPCVFAVIAYSSHSGFAIKWRTSMLMVPHILLFCPSVAQKFAIFWSWDQFMMTINCQNSSEWWSSIDTFCIIRVFYCKCMYSQYPLDGLLYTLVYYLRLKPVKNNWK